MSAYLFTWNPKKWIWADQSHAVYLINNGDPYDIRWNCGGTKRIKVGDLFFLMRVGVKPKGIIGCGYVVRDRYEHLHWDADRARRGETAGRNDLSFRALSETPIVTLSELDSQFPRRKWTPESSGTIIPDLIATELWKRIQSKPSASFLTSTHDEVKVYAEGRLRITTSKNYDRDPEARQSCLQHHGYACRVCGFDFEKVYGSIGSQFIEVHHLIQLADAGPDHEVEPSADLAPVCANCHRMLHKTRPPIAIEELQTILKDAKTRQLDTP